MIIRKEKRENFMKKLLNRIKKISWKDIVIFSIIFVPFLVILLIFNPGILSYDSYNQLSQIESGIFENWHPFIHTFIEMICLKVCDTPASIAFMQIFTFALLWTCICKYNRKRETAVEFIFQIVITIIIVGNPINSIYAITLWKDILYSYGILLLSFCLQIMIDNNYKLSRVFIILLSFLMAFLSKIRFNGLFVIIILIGLLIIFLAKRKNYKKAMLLILLYIIFMLGFNTLEKIYDVKDNAKSAFNTKLMHLVGYYEIKDYFSDDDYKIISNVVNITSLGNNYNPTFADPIYDITNQEQAKKYRKQLVGMVVRESFKHPVESVKYFLKSSTMTWEIVRPDDTVGVVMWLDINSINNEKNIVAKNLDKDIYKRVRRSIESTVYDKKTKTIFYSASLYMYLSLIIMILLIIISKKISYFLLLIPNLINVFIVACSTPLQDIRYIYPNFLLFYFTLILTLKHFYDKKEKI